MNLLQRTGKHTITIKDLNICVNDILLKNKDSFFLEVCYYASKGCEGDNEQPAEEEYFEITSIRSFNIVEFYNESSSIKISLDPFADWFEILGYEYIHWWLADKVYKELKENENV